MKAIELSEARRFLTELKLAHGFVGVTGMAQEWGISRQRVQTLTKKAGFPAPAITAEGANGHPTLKLYFRSEVYEWRRLQLRNPA